MTASRLVPGKELSDVEWVDVQAMWLGVDISEANGGSFLAPVQWVGRIALIQWVFRFATVTSSGTSGALAIKAPALNRLPGQYCGVFSQRGATVADTYYCLFDATNGGSFQTTMPVFSARSISITAQLTAEYLNY
jgi:hypothetical protein